MGGSLDPVYRVNNTFNPFKQSFELMQPDGVTPYRANVADVNVLLHSALLQAIYQAVQTGAALILLLSILIITKSDKRRSLVFLLNASALLVVVVRGILTMMVYTGPFYNWYRWELMYYKGAGMETAKRISAAGEVMTFTLIMIIILSLVMQVRIVCCNLSKSRRFAINAFISLVAFVTCGFRFALMVVNITWSIEGVQHETFSQFHRISSLASAANITSVVFIGISAAIFSAKLALAIEARRSLGMKQFGPMQIIFVMGCQTMCTPLIFNLVAYFGAKNAQLTGFVPTVVALSLPLSAMWAAASNEKIHVDGPSGGRIFPIGAADLATGKAYGGTANLNHTANTNDTLVADDTQELYSLKQKNSDDVEMQRLGGGVQVDRTYSVRSD